MQLSMITNKKIYISFGSCQGISVQICVLDKKNHCLHTEGGLILNWAPRSAHPTRVSKYYQVSYSIILKSNELPTWIQCRARNLPTNRKVWTVNFREKYSEQEA